MVSQNKLEQVMTFIMDLGLCVKCSFTQSGRGLIELGRGPVLFNVAFITIRTSSLENFYHIKPQRWEKRNLNPKIFLISRLLLRTVDMAVKWVFRERSGI